MLLMLQDGKRIYSICFSCTEDGRAYIGGIQGGKDIANDEIKVLTKELHGTRPKNLIISLLYGFFYSIAILKRSMPSTPIFTSKARKYKPVMLRCGWKSGAKNIVAAGINYRRRRSKKSIEEVKSKHRSQFIKREGLKELAQLEMKAALRQISGSRPVN